MRSRTKRNLDHLLFTLFYDSQLGKLSPAGGIIFIDGVLAELLACKPTDPPLRQNLSTHPLIERDRILIPVKHTPFHSPASHPRSLPRHRGEHHLPHSQPPPRLPHEDVLNVYPRPPHETGVVRKA
ncbi:hypothetical protein M5K25_021930 [Dendrobium thyrsiflorum]|uniref:Uncharacterized protein n=1 Tax=Dendrobium thyrsiflorum TaxID=117978 RepID=A0ABD0U590_DENTH